MPIINHYDTSADVARAAARHAAATLADALTKRDIVTWVLAGGSSPIEAYKALVREFADIVDWSRVRVLIGDERVVPFTSDDSNWGRVRPILFTSGPTAAMRRLPPPISESAEDAASDYAATLKAIVRDAPLDLVWLGVGEDGHTLSLAPGRSDDIKSEKLVISVHDFPSPPPDRISFTLRALEYTDQAVIFATGEAKQDVLARALDGETLPITLAAHAVEESGGIVSWLFNGDAASENS